MESLKSLSETIYCSTQPTFTCSKSAIKNNGIKCKICSKLSLEATDAILVFLLLTLNIFNLFLGF